MANEKEYGTRRRVLELLKIISEQPFRYTRKELAKKLDVHPDTLKDYFDDFRNAGYPLERDKLYRYGLTVDKPFEELKSLAQISERDLLKLLKAIDKVDTDDENFQALRKKIASLSQGIQNEHQYLSRPFVTKLKVLEQAKKDKLQVVLINYHSSNSNMVADRLVEAFHFEPNLDVLQAFDLTSKQLRHFRLSRIKRIGETKQAWQFESEHKILATDPFRIVNDEQVMVHLRMKVGAYNEIVERFPLTKAFIQEDPTEEGVYDFQCQVNKQFFGLSNFILGRHHDIVEIIQPLALKQHLRERIRDMNF